MYKSELFFVFAGLLCASRGSSTAKVCLIAVAVAIQSVAKKMSNERITSKYYYVKDLSISCTIRAVTAPPKESNTRHDDDLISVLTIKSIFK